MSLLELLIVLAVLGLALWGLARAARRQMRIFVFEAREGRIVSLSGRIPKRLLGDVTDIVERDRTTYLKVTCALERGDAVLDFNAESDPGVRQMIRNVVGQYPALRLKQAPPIRRK